MPLHTTAAHFSFNSISKLLSTLLDHCLIDGELDNELDSLNESVRHGSSKKESPN